MNQKMKWAAAMLGLAMTLSGQTKVDLRGQSKNVDFSGADSTKPFRSGSTLPATCQTGEMFFHTSAPAGANLYACTGTNLWTLQSGSGGSGGGSISDLGVTQSSGTSLTINPGAWGSGNTTFNYGGGALTITTLAVSGATNASPIQITVPSTANLRNGDTVNITGVQGNTAANGTFTVLVMNPTQFRLLGTTGNGNYTGGGTVAGSGSGTAFIYGNDTGALVVEHASSAGLILSCQGSCVVNQMPSPSVAASGVPVAMVNIVGGQWQGVSDRRRMLSNRAIAAGLGMTVNEAGGTATIAVDATVARTAAANIWTGSNSYTAATRTAPFRTGTGTPLTQNCTQGDSYWQSDASAGQNLWGCVTTGTPGVWVLLSAGSSSRAPVVEEEFLSTSATASSFGQYGWRSIGDNAPVATLLAGAAGFAHPGVYSLDTNAAANSTSAVTLTAATGAQQFGNLGAATGWTMEAIAITDSAEDGAQAGYRFGLSSNGSAQAASDAIQVRFNNNSGCSTTGTDTGWTYENRSGGASVTGNSSQAIAANQSVHIRVRSVTAGTGVFSVSINGADFTPEVSVTGLPTAGLSPFFAATSCSGTVKRLRLDYFRFTPGVLAR